MSDFALSVEADAENPTTGDLLIRDGQIVLVDGVAAIRQEIEIRLSWWYREWFANRRAGLPWLEMLTGKASTATIAAVVRTAIASTPGVLAVHSVTVTPDAPERTFAVSFEAEVDGSDTPLVFVDFVIPIPERSAL